MTSSLKDKLYRHQTNGTLKKPISEQPLHDTDPTDTATDNRSQKSVLLNLQAQLNNIAPTSLGKVIQPRKAKSSFDLFSLDGATEKEVQGIPIFYTEKSYPLTQKHGNISFMDLQPHWSEFSTSFHFDKSSLEQSLFFDLETTGLAGGTGTFPFMIGLGWFNKDRVHIRQYFARSFKEEYPVLQDFIATLYSFQTFVSYNGKSFDLPLLLDRLILNKIQFNADTWEHIDLLFLTRRFWKKRLRDCSLKNIEKNILELHRIDDVDGSQVPDIYFRYLKGYSDKKLERVFYHNHLDILSLMALPVAIYNHTERLSQGDSFAVDLLAAGSYYFNRHDYVSALPLLQKAEALGFEDLEHRSNMYRLLGLCLKRLYDRTTAFECWQTMQQHCPHDPLPLLELAKIYEHSHHDYDKAIKYTEMLLQIKNVQTQERISYHHRLERLKKKREG